LGWPRGRLNVLHNLLEQANSARCAADGGPLGSSDAIFLKPARDASRYFTANAFVVYGLLVHHWCHLAEMALVVYEEIALTVT
jgi:hypothetical protein